MIRVNSNCGREGGDGWGMGGGWEGWRLQKSPLNLVGTRLSRKILPNVKAKSFDFNNSLGGLTLIYRFIILHPALSFYQYLISPYNVAV